MRPRLLGQTLVTRDALVVAVPALRSLISAPLVGAVPAVASGAVRACRTQTEKSPGHKPGLCRPFTHLNHR